MSDPMTLKPAAWMCSTHRFMVMTAPLQRCACCLSERCSTAPTEPLFTRDDLVRVAEVASCAGVEDAGGIAEALEHLETNDEKSGARLLVAEMLGEVEK